MNAMNMSNLVLWGVQGFLALFFLAAGAPKLIGRGLERWTGFSELPRPMVVFIGVTEVLGAAGLVLPMATGVLPWLTPLPPSAWPLSCSWPPGSTCAPTNASTRSRRDCGPASPS